MNPSSLKLPLHGAVLTKDELELLGALDSWVATEALKGVPAFLYQPSLRAEYAARHFISLAEDLRLANMYDHSYVHAAIMRHTGMMSMHYTGKLYSHFLHLDNVGHAFAWDLVWGLVESVHQGYTINGVIVDEPDVLLRVMKDRVRDKGGSIVIEQSAGRKQVMSLREWWIGQL